jgi:hypothetical protein
MSNSTTKILEWKAVAELVGVISIVASLIFVGLQLNQSQKIALNEWGYSLVESNIAINNAYNEHPEIWAKGNAGEPLDMVEDVVYRNLLQISWGNAYWNVATQRRIGNDNDVAIHDFAAFLFQNPGARTAWESEMETEQQYRDILLNAPAGVDFMNIVLSDLKSLDSHVIE